MIWFLLGASAAFNVVALAYLANVWRHKKKRGAKKKKRPA